MADDDEKKEDDGEEKEEEVEEEEDSSEDEAEEGEVKFKDDEEAEAAEKWSMMYFKVKYKKHLYLIAKELNVHDDEIKMKEMLKVREWKYTVKNIEFTNKGDLGDYFLCFKLGYSYKIFKKYEMSKKDWKKKMKDNPPPKKDVFGRPLAKPHRKYEWVTEGSDGVLDYTAQYMNMTTGMHKKFDQDRFERTWKGSYLDLYQQKLRVEMWRSGGMWPNQAVSFHEIPMVDVASNAMFQKFDFLCADKIGTKRIAFCEFDLVFQQKVNFFLVFKHWHGALKWSCFKRLQDNGSDDVTVDSTKIEDDDEYETMGGSSGGENLSVKSHLFLRVFDANEAEYRIKKRAQSIRLARPVTISSLSNEKADAAQHQTFYTQFSFPLGSPICVTKTTKIELEQSELHAKISHQRMLGKTLLATSKIPLKGVMITGAVKGPVSTLASQDGGELQGSIVITPTMESRLPAQDSQNAKVEKQMYYKYLQKGELRHREILDFPPWNYRYLVIRLKAAEAERMFSEERLTIFFTLEWGGQCQTTREFPDFSGGEIDETLYFQIVTYDQGGQPTVFDLDHRPYVTISCWQKMDSGTNRCLSRTRYFLHNITGAERRPGASCKQYGCAGASTRKVEIFKRRNTLLHNISPVSVANWTFVYEPIVVRTRVHSGIIPLRPTMGTDAKAILELEGYFRGPERGSYPIDVDLLEIDEKRRRENNDFPWLILRHASEKTEKEKTALCHCLEYCEKVDKRTQKRMRCPQAYTELRESIGACNTLKNRYADKIKRIIETDLNCSNPPPLGSLLIKPKDAVRPIYYTYMCCLDEDDIARFLPSYLTPITPPKDFKKYENPERLEIAEKRDEPASKQAKAKKKKKKKKKSKNKKNKSSNSNDTKGGDEDMMDEEEEKEEMTRLSFPQTSFELLQYVKSFEFSDFRADSSKGKQDLKLVRNRMFSTHCVSSNYFLNARKGTVREHVILLCNLFLGLELDAYVCVGRVQTESMTTGGLQEHCWVMTREPDNSSWPDKDTRGNDAAVRFWEVTNGKVYTLPSRCSAFVSVNKRRSQADDEESSKQTDMNDQTKIDEESFYKFIEHNEAKFDRLLEKEGINQPYEIFVEGVGMGDGVGTNDEIKKMSADREAMSLLRSKGEQHKQKKERVRNASWQNLTERHRDMLKNIRSRKVGTPNFFPYKEIFAVFNAQNYWVNTHRLVLEKPQKGVQRNPAMITYDMGGDFEANRDWEPFKTSQRGAGLGRPFFTPRSLSSALAPDYVAQLENRITLELEEGICNMRINIGASTKVAPKMAPLIKELLFRREMLERMDQNEFNGWKEGKWDRSSFPRSEGVKRQKKYNEALKHLVDARLPNYKFRIKMSTLSTADPLQIRKIALDGATPEELAIYLHGTSYDKDKRKGVNMVEKHDSDNRQIFAIGVKMFGLYNGVVKTRIGVMVIWPEKSDPEAYIEAKMKEKREEEKRKEENEEKRDDASSEEEEPSESDDDDY